MMKAVLLGGVAVVAAFALAAPADAGDVKTKWKGAPQTIEDGNTFKVRGRAIFDYVVSEGDVGSGGTTLQEFDGREFTTDTLRIGAEGKIAKAFSYKMEIETKQGSTKVKDAIVGWKFAPNTTLMVGNYRPFNSLENHTSGRYISTTERVSFLQAWGSDRNIGIGVMNTGENYTIGAGVFGESINSSDSTTGGLPDQEPTQFNIRGTYSPINEKGGNQVHVGAWFQHRDAGDGTALRYRAKSGTNGAPRWVSTSNFAEKDNAFGLEAAWVNGPLSFQGEYSMVSAENATAGGVDPEYDAWYLLATYSLTGEGRNYKANKGSFGRPKVARPITEGGPGHVELALRYDTLDLTSSDTLTPAVSPTLNTNGGEQNTFVVGLNWWPINYVRFTADYVNADIDGPYGDGDVNSVVLRTQIDW